MQGGVGFQLKPAEWFYVRLERAWGMEYSLLMAFTFAHPAAVLPFRRLCPGLLNFGALVAGSMTPDVCYFLHQWKLAAFAHTALGSVLFDLPAGALLLFLYCWCARQLAVLLPSPHREIVMESSWCGKISDLRTGGAIVISLLLGAWTHLLWDGFTHSTGWFVREDGVLSAPLAYAGDYAMAPYKILQHVSTIAGLAVVVVAYLSAVRSREKRSVQAGSAHLPVKAIWMFVFIVPAIVSGGLCATAVVEPVNVTAVSRTVFSFVVNYVAVLAITLGLTAIAMRWMGWSEKRGNGGDTATSGKDRYD